MVYVYLVGSYACSDQVGFGADMLYVVTVEPLLAFNIVYGPLIQPVSSHFVNSHFVNSHFWSTFHFVNSHFVNSHLVNVDKVGIDEMGIDKVGS